jgi:hypothetical protein
MGMRSCCCSRESRNDVNKVACSEEFAGTANAAERACNGSNGELFAAAIYTDRIDALSKELLVKARDSTFKFRHCLGNIKYPEC